MTDFHFVPAAEIQGRPPCLIGLSGMTGSGKTFSGLLIAQALARVYGGPVMRHRHRARPAGQIQEPRAVSRTAPLQRRSDTTRPSAANVFVTTPWILAVSKFKAGCIIIDSGQLTNGKAKAAS